MSAAEMTSAFREFAFKKFSEAKQRGATIATATAATAASITSSVPVSAGVATSFVFRSNSTRQQQEKDEPVSMENKLSILSEANEALKKRTADHPMETLDTSINKVDLINESLAFTIENIQECSHMLKMMHRQMRELGAMGDANDLVFFKQEATATTTSTSATYTSADMDDNDE